MDQDRQCATSARSKGSIVEASETGPALRPAQLSPPSGGKQSTIIDCFVPQTQRGLWDVAKDERRLPETWGDERAVYAAGEGTEIRDSNGHCSLNQVRPLFRMGSQALTFGV